jgi:predicted PurR-regulated permease PerM
VEEASAVIEQLSLWPDGRLLRRLDVVVAVWTLVFLVHGVVAGIELWNLSGLSTTLRQASTAIDEAGRGVALVQHIPLIGTGAGTLADSIQASAVNLRADAAQVGSTARVLSVVIGVAVVLVGLAPLTLMYLPLRIARSRETRALARLLRQPAELLLVEHLAHAAVNRLPYSQLRRLTPTPWRDLEQGHHHHLAAAELRRLGVPVPPEWSDERT